MPVAGDRGRVSFPRSFHMPLYRAYLIEDGHVWTAFDLSYADDDDAKEKAEDLLDEQGIELWQRDRKVALLRAPHRN